MARSVRSATLAGLLLAGLHLACARTAPPRLPEPEPIPPAAEPQAGEPGAPAAPEAGASPPSVARPQPPEAAPPAAADPPAAPALEPPVPSVDATEPPRMPDLVRVGLATDLAEVRFPCCGEGELVASSGSQALAVLSPILIEPAAGAVTAGSYRLQVAALKDERQATSLAANLAAKTGEPADVVFDAGTDLYRVRVGRYASRDEAERGSRRLTQHNVHDAWIVSESGRLEQPAIRISQGGTAHIVRGRWVEVRRSGGEGIRVAGKRYRGRILVYLNDRGSLNLVNEVSLENYLRGVVPREMGPAIYDEIEALKAQTVAARTYALKNLREFSGEGYDICATPRCQVYGGMDSEHELTDRAISETAGEVLVYEGGLVDALYSSTCGGHTEDVHIVFPLKSEPYLKGVPCLEQGVDRLAGSTPRGASVAGELVRRLLPPGGAEPGLADVQRRFERLVELAGLPAPRDRLRSLERREVQRYIASLFDLVLDVRLFVARADVDYLLETRPPDWSPEDLELAAYLVTTGLLSGAVDRPLSAEELDGTLFHLARRLQVLEEREGRYLSIDDRTLRFKREGEPDAVELPAGVATFRGVETPAGVAALALVPGDRLTLYSHHDSVLGVAQRVDSDGVGYDRTSNRSAWTRFKTDSELSRQVRDRYPDLAFTDLKILERGVSGRVGSMRLMGEAGASEVVRGLPVRWTLDIPDTLFTVKRLRPPGKEPGWLFTGRGWGHGVGMCQVGSYGMALRGHDYRTILGHYYTGVRLAKAKLGGGA